MSNAAEMDAQEIINYIATAPKKTPVKLYVREKPGMKVAWGDAHVYGGRRGKTVFGDWDELKAILDANADSIDYYDVENDCRNSAVPMLDLKGINARIEPGAIIRDRVEIGDRAVIMMGAIINIGSVAAVCPDRTQVGYGVAKSGINHLSRQMARQVAHAGVRVNVLNPGIIATEAVAKHLTPETQSRYTTNCMIKHLGEPIDIAYMALYLASDESKYVTAHVMNGSGGWM